MKVLIIGGTRFFGKRLVTHALASGCDVVVATRGKATLDIPREAVHVKVDRHDRESMQAAFAGRTFDVVYDQLAYTPNDALISCDVFDGNIGRYVLTSSASVYEPQMLPLKEEQFDPWKLAIRYGGMNDFNYADGKRYAEAVFFQRATFPVAAVRFPIVIGEDDYTGRFRFHVERIKRGQAIGVPGNAAKMSFILAEEAGAFLHWVGTSNLRGPVNAASHTPLTAVEICQIIAEEVGREAILTMDDSEGIRSPYYISRNFTLNLVKAYRNGYRFTKSKEWLPSVIKKVVREVGNCSST